MYKQTKEWQECSCETIEKSSSKISDNVEDISPLIDGMYTFEIIYHFETLITKGLPT